MKHASLRDYLPGKRNQRQRYRNYEMSVFFDLPNANQLDSQVIVLEYLVDKIDYGQEKTEVGILEIKKT